MLVKGAPGQEEKNILSLLVPVRGQMAYEWHDK